MKLQRVGIALSLGFALTSLTNVAANAADDQTTVINDALAVVGEAPITSTTSDAEVTTGGVTIEGDESATARTTSTGSQVIDVLTEGERSTSFAVDVPDGYQLEQIGDTVGVVSHVAEGAGDDATESLLIHGTFEEPWAVDADGDVLPTSYEIVGDTLVQTVDTDGASYPIVADPSFTYSDFKYSWSIWQPYQITAQANKRGSRMLANGYQTAFCAGVAFAPVVGPGLAAACAVSVAVDNIVYEYGWCVEVKFNGITRRISKGYYKGGFCT